MVVKIIEFFGLDVRLKIKGIFGVNLSVKLLKEFVELFGIFLMEINDGGFNVLIIKVLFLGIFLIIKGKKFNLYSFVILEYGIIE